MYRPKHYAIDDIKTLHDFIQKRPLGLIISNGNHLEANLIPMQLYQEGEKGVLRCHLARANTQLDSIKESHEVLIVFTGPQGYVSPNLYPTKVINEKAVPTWNYTMVQVRGKAVIKDDRAWIMKQINDMTDIQESMNEKSWKVSDAPVDYIENLAKGIVGVEIEILSIEGKFKWSQNQPEENRKKVEEYFNRSVN